MNMQPGSYRLRLMAATALVSVVLIAYQVAIIQLLSYMQWYHYANMVISIALLGFGAAGTLLSLKRNWLLNHSNILLPILTMLCGLTMATAVELVRSGVVRFDSYLLFVDRIQWLKLLFNSLLFFIPFLLGALVLGIIFIKHVREIGKNYFLNLIGSGIGAVLAATLSWSFLPVSLPLFFSLVAIITALLFLRGKNQWWLIIVALVIAGSVFYRINKQGPIRMSEYKSLSKTMHLPSAHIEVQKPGPYGLVQVVSAEALRYAPGLSLAFEREVPVKKVLFNNGDWYGAVDSWGPRDSLHLFDYTTMDLPYVLKKRENVLVLNAGAGLHTSHALHHKASLVDAVEPHGGIYHLVLNELAVDNDSLFYRNGIRIYNSEPRSFLSVTKNKYDLIQLSLIGAFGGGTGLYAMREEYTLTKEAFLKMWNLLKEDGIISISAWMDYPFRYPLKITALLSETLKDAGITDHQSHFAAIRSWGTVTFILTKSPLSSSDTSAIRMFCSSYFFDPLLLPGVKNEERATHNGISDSSFFAYTDELLSDKKEKLYREYDFHIRPATDDKPYFSQFLRWKSLSNLKENFGAQTFSFLELGRLIAAANFIIILLLAILFIILPLLKPGFRGTNKGWTILYFSGLGAGYMLLEIILMQKFILFFGSPVYATAFVICTMLLASGVGSFYSSRLLPTRNLMQRILLVIFFILLLYTLFLSPFLNVVNGLPDFFKLLISLLLIVLPAILMGIPFPLGMRMLAEKQEKIIPWAWGINSCVSVISAAFAGLLTVEAGFSIGLFCAAIFYSISMLSLYLLR